MILFLSATKDDWWVYLLAAGISSGALAALFTGVSKLISNWRQHKAVENLGRIFYAGNQLNNTLQALRADVAAVRTLVLKSTNGGGVPTIGKPLYSSIVYESYGSGSQPIRKRWQDIEVDNQYMGLLSDVYSEGMVLIETETIADGDLKNILTDTGITHSVACRIGCNETAMFYLAVDFKNKEHSLTAGEMSYIRAAAAALTTLFKKHDQIYMFDFNNPSF